MKLENPTTYAILTHIGTFGYLTTREVGMLTWHSITQKSALKSAQSWLTRLRKEGLVLARELPFSGVTHAYVLTRAGADMLIERYIDQYLADESDDGLPWFAHGYDLSLNMAMPRHVLIELCSRLMAEANLVPVGQRGLVRGFLGKREYKHFDAALLSTDGQAKFGVYLAAGFGTRDQERVKELSKAGTPFLIVCQAEKGLQVLSRVRARTNPAMAEYIQQELPAGILA